MVLYLNRYSYGMSINLYKINTFIYESVNNFKQINLVWLILKKVNTIILATSVK